MVGIAGMVLGPSAGHWYAGEGVTTGLLLRGGAAVATGALVLGDPHLERPAPTLLGLLGAVGVWEVGVIWDAWTLPRAIRRHNRALEVQVAPLVTTHGVTPGVTLAGRF